MRINLQSQGVLSHSDEKKEKIPVSSGGVVDLEKKKGPFFFNGKRIENTVEIPQLIGHRGLGIGKKRLENRVEGVKRCFTFCPMAEIDVQVTKDRKVVLYHDEHIDSKNIDELLYEEIKDKADLLSDLLKETEIGLNIEVKYRNQKNISVSEWCREILAVVEKEPGGKREIVYSSFNRDVCEEIVKSNPHVLLLLEKLAEEDISYATERQYIGIVTEAGQIEANIQLVHKIKKESLYLLTYGKRNSSIVDISMQKRFGVDSIISDEVESLSRFIYT